MGAGIAQVDAVQAQQRPARRKTARRFAVGLGEDFLQPAARQLGIGALAPVVEVARDDHRRRWRQAAEQPAQ
ncbi:hypothetical protein D9M71_710420 [compost metagenome]